MNPYLKQYQQSQIQTASPEKILIMLYDGAIQFLNKALKALQDNNIEEMHNNILGAQKIIAEFMNTLDMEIEGELVQNLYSLYEYLHFRLVQANINKNPKMIEEVLQHLKELKQTWEQAIKIASKEKESADIDLENEETSDYEDDEEIEDDEEYDEENEDNQENSFVG